jgi:hypothetical protein
MISISRVFIRKHNLLTSKSPQNPKWVAGITKEKKKTILLLLSSSGDPDSQKC